MLKIRLARGGAKKRPYYSIVVADSHSPRDGRFIEKVGSYNPLLKKDDPQRVVLKVERIQEWMKKGAQPTDRVARELSLQGVGQWRHGDNPKKGEPGAKAKERVEARARREADRQAAIEEARNAPAAEEPAPAEDPADASAAEPENTAQEAPAGAAPEGVEDAPAEASAAVPEAEAPAAEAASEQAPAAEGEPEA